MPSKAQRETMNSPLAMDLTKGICYLLLFDGVDTDDNVKRDIEKSSLSHHREGGRQLSI